MTESTEIENSVFEPEGRAIPYVDEMSEGDGPALVLIPGRGLEGGALGSVAHILAGEGIRVLRIGSRGSGDVSVEEWAADASDVMDHVGIGATWIGGHGVGGTVARTLSAQRTDRALGVLLLGVEDVDAPIAPSVPVLIIQGSADEVMPAANGEKLRDAMSERASVVTIEGGGHLFPVSDPVDTAFAIEDYLAWD
ncbi:alpha/beta hydrolase [Microbacterium capsulatum]|uniref:Alpha/beta hydrolase n=1 Tax=Microbacterium capsulatum TaxID=3041921 RepID=A0ABU0XFR8_9MICO|nr:alpha/beta hydrolase [Microbacterium sp. ASV81]MDQ4213968.1 alpha/beta hydrolase [Microbacterium sp. ASV81]